MAFHGDTRLAELMSNFIRSNNVELIIETGTSVGYTTEFFARHNIPVIGTEIGREVFDEAVERLKQYNNVKLLFGDSTDSLKDILPQYRNKRVFFFLDSHFGDDLSLNRELDLIDDSGIIPYITIHDFKVPNTTLGYDKWDKMEYDFETFKPYFDKVYKKFKGYRYTYNDDSAVGARRGCIFLRPLEN